MKIKRTKLLRIIGKKLITLPWGVYAAPKALVTEDDMTHEFIHIKQWRELLYIGFILWCALEWLARLIQYRNFDKAYKNISFEREAYSNQGNTEYLNTRRLYSFIKYLRVNG